MERELLYQRLLAFVSKRVKNSLDAEDIVQDVFLKAQLKRHQLKEAEKFTAWMFTLTRNSIMDFYRERKKSVGPEFLTVAEGHNDFSDCVSGCVHDALTSLPEDYRNAIKLIELENIPQTELAERLQMSYSGAKSRVQRARYMLKEKLESLYHIKTDGYGNVLACNAQHSCAC